jgi:hypothetical protein
MPKDAAYRIHTEEITKQRLSIVGQVCKYLVIVDQVYKV